MNVRELSPVLAKVAREELNEVPERMKSDLNVIKEWIAKQPHLNARTGCKYSLQRTKDKLDMFYAMRSTVPEIALAPDVNEEWVQEILTKGVCVPLPNTVNPYDPRVIIIRPGTYDPNKIPIVDTLRVNQLFGIIQIMEDDQSVIVGQRFIIDLSNITMSHFTQMTPSLVKKMVMTSQDAMPFRQKGTHHIHTPPGTETIFSFFRRFMNEKNRNRFFIHNEDMEALYKFVPKAILPTEYGGDAGPIQTMIDDWKIKVESHRDWILDDRKYKTYESKRSGEGKISETLFGIDGSFRQLNVD